ncbi:MAG: hypothetical protein EON91_05485 [Brevundimonas sp.]|uniref:2OG-Fe(II) oxygenase n=1 Tax=Brevundimonas sp. TaxID=1871086 RepID=UPI0012143AC5|nr:2OG-Fe(II) oxygenase family protein [Brevundimonas sp.]RZJ18339.1 MAG: hypothetical protein EON91_05485 [Brevundimonas sp.]
MTAEVRLAPGLDIPALREAFAARGRLHILNVLTPDAAEAVAATLEAETAWKMTCAAGGFFELPLNGRVAADPDKQSWIDEARVDPNTPRMQYMFDTRRLGQDWGDEPRTPDAADAVLAFLNTPAFLDFARAVTGDDRIDFADAQASRYRPGHLLTAHNDLSAGKNRLYAYVLNLTRDWRADWGGVLMFQGDDGHVEHGWTPAFNALNLFTVPTRHAVSQVAAHAPRDRLSIVGWLRSNSPVGPQLPPA